MPWHTRCPERDCHWRCQRPGCTAPDVHFLIHQEAGESRHNYDCTQAASAARQAVAELRPDMAPDEIAIARRVLAEALDRLERLDRTAEVPRPTIYRASA